MQPELFGVREQVRGVAAFRQDFGKVDRDAGGDDFGSFAETQQCAAVESRGWWEGSLPGLQCSFRRDDFSVPGREDLHESRSTAEVFTDSSAVSYAEFL